MLWLSTFSSESLATVFLQLLKRKPSCGTIKMLSNSSDRINKTLIQFTVNGFPPERGKIIREAGELEVVLLYWQGFV